MEQGLEVVAAAGVLLQLELVQVVTEVVEGLLQTEPVQGVAVVVEGLLRSEPAQEVTAAVEAGPHLPRLLAAQRLEEVAPVVELRDHLLPGLGEPDERLEVEEEGVQME